MFRTIAEKIKSKKLTKNVLFFANAKIIKKNHTQNIWLIKTFVLPLQILKKHKMNITQAENYFLHHIRAIHTKGFHVHSPFLYDLTRNVIYENNSYYCFAQIEQQRHQLLRNHTVIDVTDYGTKPSGKRKISDIAEVTLATEKEAQLLFRLSNYVKAKNILELGTSLGISTAYLVMPNSKCRVTTFEGSQNIARQAQNVWKQLKIQDRIHCIVGNIDNTLQPFLNHTGKLDLIYIDANHTEEATLKYYKMCLPHVNENAIMIFDDIDLNKGMAQAWQTIKQQEEVKATIDLYSLGLVFFNKYLIKQDYRMIF